MSQSESAPTPEAVVRTYFAALDAERFEEVVGCFDPVSVAEFSQYQIETARVAEESSATIVEMDLTGGVRKFSWDPDQEPGPPGRSEGSPFPLVRKFADIETLDQLKQLEPAEMILRFLQARAPEYQRQQTLREGRNPMPDDSAPDERQVLGTVMEGEAMAHVVFRSISASLGDELPAILDVVTLRRTDAGWRIVFSVHPPGLYFLSYSYSSGPIQDGDSLEEH